MKENPLVMNKPEKIAIAVGLLGGAAAALYYFMRPTTSVAASPPAPVNTTPQAAVTLTPANAGQTSFVSVNGMVTVNLPLSATVTSWTDTTAPGGTALQAAGTPQTSADGSTMTFTYSAVAQGYQTLTFTPSSGNAINFAVQAS